MAEDDNPMRGFSDLASLFNCGIIILTLGSYGLLLPASVFWLCWTMLVIDAIIFYTIRPYCSWIDPSPSQSHSANGRTGAVFIKVSLSIALVVMLFYNRDFRQRQNKILLFAACSIILFEGFVQIIVAREELNALMSKSSSKGMDIMIFNITEGCHWNAVKLLLPSAINVMICVTGAIVLGGKLGSILSDNLYWIVISMFVVDLMAEGIHRFDCGNRSTYDPIPQTMPRRHYLGNVLRVVVEGLLCYCMIKEIYEKHYYHSDADVKGCASSQCEERSRSLFITMAALSGIQATVAFAIPLGSCVLGFLLGKTEIRLNSVSKI